jgi:hypothetical protein
MKSIKTGDEYLVFKSMPTSFRLRDFWKWSVSDLVSNVTRGRLAEFIGATSLGIDLETVRDEWQAYDLLTPEGIKVEVKSASYVQSWAQKKLSSITFSTRATRYWDSETNVQAKIAKRQADVYVFCLLKHLDKNTINPLNLDQWEFYVLSAGDLQAYKRSKVSITLKSLQKLSSPVTYDRVRDVVLAKHRMTGHGA